VPTKQGDIGLLRDPVAQQLLQSKFPAHLAYTWREGTPRVVPIGFHWNGAEIVLAIAPDAPKTSAPVRALMTLTLPRLKLATKARALVASTATACGLAPYGS
jgi:hypothetical protein